MRPGLTAQVTLEGLDAGVNPSVVALQIKLLEEPLATLSALVRFVAVRFVHESVFHQRLATRESLAALVAEERTLT